MSLIFSLLAGVIFGAGLTLSDMVNPERVLNFLKPLWGEPVRLDNRKLIATLGHEPRTPLQEAVAATLRGIGAL